MRSGDGTGREALPRHMVPAAITTPFMASPDFPAERKDAAAFEASTPYPHPGEGIPPAFELERARREVTA